MTDSNASSTAVDVNDAEFESVVLGSSEPVLVDFWAPWCGPCRAVSPVLDKISAEHGLKIAKVNIDENQETAQKYRVASIPMMILFDEGEIAKKVVGALPQRELEAKLGPELGWS